MSDRNVDTESYHPDDLPSTWIPRPLEEGEVVGLWRVGELLGRGAFGQVYFVTRTKPFKQAAALKLLLPGKFKQSFIENFEDERDHLAAMHHSNIAQIIDGGSTDDGQPYFVMDFVDGGTILEYCDNRTIGLEGRLRYFIDVCNGVEHVHRKGIVHRDIKPSNVMMRIENDVAVPKVVDFGIAMCLREDVRPNLAGTLYYMSPEQAKNDGGVGSRSDIYSLGALLYELMVGVTPFDDDNLESTTQEGILDAVIKRLPPTPSDRLQSLGANSDSVASLRKLTRVQLRTKLREFELDGVVMRALAKDPSDRFPTAQAMGEAVQEILDRRPTPHVRRRIRRNAMISIAAVAILAFSAIGFWQRSAADRQSTRYLETEVSLFTNPTLAREQLASYIQDYPDDVRAHEDLVNALFRVGKSPEACEMVRSSSHLSQSAELQFAMYWCLRDRPTEAESFRRSCLDLVGDYSFFRARLAQPEVGIPILEGLLKQTNDPTVPWTQHQVRTELILKYMNSKNDRLDDAEMLARKSIELALGDEVLSARAMLAYSLMLQRKLEEAESLLGSVIEIKPDYIAPYLNRAQVRINRGDFDGALDDCDFVLNVGRYGTLMALGSKARALIEKSKEAHSSAQASNLLARAERTAKIMLDESSGDHQAVYYLAAIQFQRRNLTRAFDLLQEIEIPSHEQMFSYLRAEFYGDVELLRALVLDANGSELEAIVRLVASYKIFNSTDVVFTMATMLGRTKAVSTYEVYLLDL
ncbi:MAG: protein kinase domain-containing protein, partial [Phycisphaerae bacterium]